MSQLVVATANVLRSLSRHDAATSLEAVLARRPDIVGLQEWGITRWALLGESGRVRVVPGWRRSSATDGYLWCVPVYGGCSVGVRAERFDLVDARLSLLGTPGRADNPARPLGLEPPRVATVVRLEDREAPRRRSVICFHLVPGIQRGGSYREDRPGLVARHRHEVRALEVLVDHERGWSDEVCALGDSNYDGLALSGLTSAWDGRSRPGTLGGRTIDDVFGAGPATHVELVTTASDHAAVIATR